jgi:hypothetical protein
LEGAVELQMFSVPVVYSREASVAQVYSPASRQHPYGVASEVVGSLNHQMVPLVWEKIAKVSHEQTQPRPLLPIQKNHEGATLEVIVGYLVRIRNLLAASEELEKGIFQGLTSWPSFL